MPGRSSDALRLPDGFTREPAGGRLPESHVLTDRRYRSWEEMQRARNAAPSARPDFTAGPARPDPAGRPDAAAVRPDAARPGAARGEPAGHRDASWRDAGLRDLGLPGPGQRDAGQRAGDPVGGGRRGDAVTAGSAEGAAGAAVPQQRDRPGQDQPSPGAPPPYSARHAVTEHRASAPASDPARLRQVPPDQAQQQAGQGISSGQDGNQASAGGERLLHWQSQFHGHQIDVWSDGKRWAHEYKDMGPGTGNGDGTQARDSDQHSDRNDAVHITPASLNYLRTGDRAVGIPVVGPKPDKSPGDHSDFGRTGEEIVEGDDDDEEDLSIAERAANKTLKEAGDVIDVSQNLTTWVDDALHSPVPTGEPVVGVPGHDVFTVIPPSGGVDAGSLAAVVAVGAVLAIRFARWVGHKVSKDKGDERAGN